MIIKINENEIEASTNRAYLVKIPKSSLKFWFPISKTCQRGGLIYLKFPETWYFELIQKDGKLHELGRTDSWIMKHLGMDADEVIRLKQLSGLASLFEDRDFSKAWEADKEKE